MTKGKRRTIKKNGQTNTPVVYSDDATQHLTSARPFSPDLACARPKTRSARKLYNKSRCKRGYTAIVFPCMCAN